MKYYTPEIVEHGWHLCEYCTEELLDACDLAGEVDLPDTVTLQWWKAADQLELPDVALTSRLCFCVNDKPVEGLTFDEAAVIATAQDMDLDYLEEYNYGISLSGTKVENIAYKGVTD